jgi:CheY-like chemotaxis protein
MNICAKINSMAPQNGMVIGSVLYDYYCSARKSSSSLFSNYHFKIVLVSKNRLDTIITPIHKNLKSYSDHDYDQQQLQHQKQQNDHSILLVDDEPDTLLTYKTFLLDIEGYNVDAFTDSQKALQHFAQVNPSYYDLVVMDIRMPGLNGLQLYYRIKAMNPDIKVLFVSALDAAKEMVSILPGVKIEDIIQKPVNQEYFVNKIKATLG